MEKQMENTCRNILIEIDLKVNKSKTISQNKLPHIKRSTHNTKGDKFAETL